MGTVIKIFKDMHHYKPYFKLIGFQEAWPIQTGLIKMSLFSHRFQDYWHQRIFFKAAFKALKISFDFLVRLFPRF